VAIQPLYLKYDDYGPAPFAVNLAVTMEKNRIAVDSGTLTTGATRVDVNGALEDLNAPRAHIQYRASVALTDVARIVRVPQLRTGRALVDGTGEWTPASGVALNGRLHATGVEYRDNVLRLVDFRGDGAVSASAKGVTAEGLRVSGFYARGAKREALQGQVGNFSLRNKDIEIGGVALSLLSGSFRGKARLRQLEHYSVTGEVSGVDTRRAIALFISQPLPWDALVFGGVTLEGSLKGVRTCAPAAISRSHRRLRAIPCTANSTWRTTPAPERWTWDGPPSACRTRGRIFRAPSTANSRCTWRRATSRICCPCWAATPPACR
jgi:hypothetical protein